MVIVLIYLISLIRLIFSSDIYGENHAGLTVKDLLHDDNFRLVVYPQGSSQYLLEVRKLPTFQREYLLFCNWS